MNALKASSRSGGIPLTQRCSLPAIPIETDPVVEEDVSNDDEVSLDDLSVVSSNIKEKATAARVHGKTVVGIEDNCFEVKISSNLSNAEPTTISSENAKPTTIRHIKEFLEPYLGTKPLQPTNVLQQRYNALQHEQYKQAQTQSVKPWYRYEQRGDCKDLWWVSTISIPPAVAKHWGFGVTEKSPLNVSSGYLSLSLNEWEMLIKANDGKDLLHDLFGVYKKHSETSSNGEVQETLWFKTKSGAQKNCTLNLLFLMDDHKSFKVQGEPMKGMGNGVKPKQFPEWVDKLFDMGFGSQESGQRFKLRSIKYHAALKDPSGCILSSDNPCLIKCVVTYVDSKSDNELVAVTSEGYFSQEESFEDVMSRLEASVSELIGRPFESQANEISEKEFIISAYDKNIFYEVALPPWSSCKIGTEAFLYELKFQRAANASDEEKRVSGTCTHGPEMAESTRIGLLSGCDIFEAYSDGTHDLSAEFMMPDTRAVTVTICNRTRINLNAEIAHSGKFECDFDPVSLMKCFNSILFENGGRTYGIAPPRSPKEILSQLEQTEHDRTYFFLPLLSSSTDFSSSSDGHDVCIDWKIVLEVVHNTATPALQPANAVGSEFYFWLAFLALAVVAIELAICILMSTSLSDRGIASSYVCEGRSTVASISTRGVVYALMVVIFGALVVTDKLVPPRRVPTSVLLNRFAKQPVELKNRVFVLDRNERDTSITALSPLVPVDVVSDMPELTTAFFKKFGVQLYDATYASYYQRVQMTKSPWGRVSSLKRYYTEAIRWLELCSRTTALKFPNEPLIKAFQVHCHKDHDYTILGDSCGTINHFDQKSITNYLAARGYLVSELTLLLPMPRDLLYLCQHACRFMTALERAHMLQLAARRLIHLSTASNLLPCNPSFTTLASLLDKATELNGEKTDVASAREEERLETLGDAVLMFLIVINLFASSSTQNEYVLDMFDDEITVLGRNKVLSEAALMLGLHRLTYNKSKSISSWKSAYTMSEASFDTNTSNMRRLSNTLESLLGASYLSDPALPVGILNQMTPCLRPLRKGKSPFYSARSTCLDVGYDFKKDLQWTTELNRINELVQKDRSVLSTLESGSSKLFNILLKHSGRHDLVQKIMSQNVLLLLIHAALFDDSLEEKDGINEQSRSQLQNLAVLRDKIFHVGNATLSIALVEEIYQQYPNATSGDLHFAKAAILSDDCLAYVHVKSGLAECLFDEKNESMLEFKSYMSLADSLGEELYVKNNGWVVIGGISEYQRRMQLLTNNEHVEVERPRYLGLAAGRLFGMKKKVSKDITGDLVFSMKAIVGALSLSFGKDAAWSLIRPLLLELILLSPDEMRETYADVSDLATKLKKGKR